MGLAFLIGRIAVGYYFLMNSYNHLFKSGHMTGYAASKGVPSPKAAIIVSGLLLLAGGLSVLLGVAVIWGLIALLVFMIPVTFMMHNYWKETDPMDRANQKISFWKNIAIIGLLLMLFAVPTPWPFAL
ncbi:MAG: DoxX family membrane protein [Patescibacteria group bacterium]|nr:DoxX family membrane protein [Patescibacteria group bacterium]MDE2116524.1 DoxX family membrane protein [Patescibacteria group bacterium]